MQLKEHVAYGAAASAAMYPVFGWKVLYFFVAEILIDADHCIDYLYFNKFKDWNVTRMFRYHAQVGEWRHRPNLCALEAFHTLEFFAGILALGLYFHSTELLLFLFGLVFHLGLDIIRLAQWKVVTLRAFSFIEYWIRAKRMKSSGVDPERIFEQAYEAVLQSDQRRQSEGPAYPAQQPSIS